MLYVGAGAPRGCPEPYPSVLQGLREVLGPQPAGTRSETWRPDDRWPGVGEWMQGIGGLGGPGPAAVRPGPPGAGKAPPAPRPPTGAPKFPPPPFHPGPRPPPPSGSKAGSW